VKNIDVKINKNQMVLTVDLSKRFNPSVSGKTIIIASTEGNAKIEGHDGLQFGLNVFAKNADAPKPGKDK
jgi:hypothetical protein